MKDICCIGHITKDKIITPRKTVYMAGGTSFYFSYAFNHLPKDVTFQLVTKLGESEMESAEAMRRVGIDVLTFPAATPSTSKTSMVRTRTNAHSECLSVPTPSPLRR